MHFFFVSTLALIYNSCAFFSRQPCFGHGHQCARSCVVVAIVSCRSLKCSLQSIHNLDCSDHANNINSRSSRTTVVVSTTRTVRTLRPIVLVHRQSLVQCCLLAVRRYAVEANGSDHFPLSNTMPAWSAFALTWPCESLLIEQLSCFPAFVVHTLPRGSASAMDGICAMVALGV